MHEHVLGSRRAIIVGDILTSEDAIVFQDQLSSIKFAAVDSGSARIWRRNADLNPDAPDRFFWRERAAASAEDSGEAHPVPPKKGVGRHEGRDSAQQPAPQAMAEFRAAPTLVVLETQPPSLKTDSQHTILFAEKRDHVLVFTLSPSVQHR